MLSPTFASGVQSCTALVDDSEETQRLGMRWLSEAKTPILKVPSAVSVGEWNFLLSPTHAEFSEVRLGEPERFEMYPRLLQQ